VDFLNNAITITVNNFIPLIDFIGKEKMKKSYNWTVQKYDLLYLILINIIIEALNTKQIYKYFCNSSETIK